jgi:hypothetical protein
MQSDPNKRKTPPSNTPENGTPQRHKTSGANTAPNKVQAMLKLLPPDSSKWDQYFSLELADVDLSKIVRKYYTQLPERIQLKILDKDMTDRVKVLTYIIGSYFLTPKLTEAVQMKLLQDQDRRDQRESTTRQDIENRIDVLSRVILDGFHLFTEPVQRLLFFESRKSPELSAQMDMTLDRRFYLLSDKLKMDIFREKTSDIRFKEKPEMSTEGSLNGRKNSLRLATRTPQESKTSTHKTASRQVFEDKNMTEKVAMYSTSEEVLQLGMCSTKLLCPDEKFWDRYFAQELSDLSLAQTVLNHYTKLPSPIQLRILDKDIANREEILTYIIQSYFVTSRLSTEVKIKLLKDRDNRGPVTNEDIKARDNVFYHILEEHFHLLTDGVQWTLIRWSSRPDKLRRFKFQLQDVIRRRFHLLSENIRCKLYFHTDLIIR